ncbi:hypothetical protein P3S68_013776 [Capsicum galapagoense]
MMNILAISLVLSTLVTAGFFSPKNKKDDVVLVVEFDKDDGTKVLISPKESEIPKGKSKSGYICDLKDKLYEKVEPNNIGQGMLSPAAYVSRQDDEENGELFHTKTSARELVCDAFGKCKEKIAIALGRNKDKASEKAHEAADQVEEGVEDAVTGAPDKAKEIVKQVQEKAKDVVDTTKRKMEHVKEEISEKTQQVKEGGKEDLKDILERGRLFFCDVFAYTFSLEHLYPVMRLTHFLGFTMAYGMCIWVTFVSSHVLARALPRQQFALVQSKIYPVYFKLMAYCVGAAFLAHFLSQKRRPYANSAEAVQGFNLLASISMLLINLLYLEPRATKVMFERLKLEKEEGRGIHISNSEQSSRGVESILDPTRTKTTSQTTTTTKQAEMSPEQSAQSVKLSQKLNKLNSYSSFLNVLTLMALTHHLVHLTLLLDAISS